MMYMVYMVRHLELPAPAPDADADADGRSDVTGGGWDLSSCLPLLQTLPV